MQQHRTGHETGFRRLEASGDLAGWAPESQKAKVYDQILLDIILGELAPGRQLDEQGLTRRYDAGLAGVRDALGRLALEGLVVRRPRAGTTVAPLDLVDVRQAFEALRLIEPHCASLAASNAGAADIAALRAAFDGAEEAARAGHSRALIGMDQRFHAALALATGNLTLAKIVIPLQHKASRFWAYSMTDDTADERIEEVQRHRALADCVARGDATAAYDAMLKVLGAFFGARVRGGRNDAATPAR
ncbi:MAG: GntR family transcriptional regulator [Caulobacteraceae bacterium]|nr:GntR family transcriptional regulator [Caulobacteraceae bacterium]